MRITFLLAEARNMSGGNRVLAQHAAWLVAQGHEVALFSRPGGPPRGLRPWLRRLMGRGWTPSRMAEGGATHFDAMGLSVTTLGRPILAADLPDADVVIAGWWETAEWMAALPPEKGVHVHFIQGYEVFATQPLDRVEAVYRTPTFKIVVSGWLAVVMKDRYGADTRIAFNGVATAAFDAPERGPSGAPTIGFLYSAELCKTVGIAIAALEIARIALPSLRAVAFGAHQPAEGVLPEWIAFEHRPPQARIPEIYAACDAWLFPSESEGFGLPILEAMACRTPVIAAPAGAAPDLIDGTNGLVVAHDPDAFAAAIARIAALSEDEWRAMSACARATAEAHGIAVASARFEALLIEAAAD